MNLAFSHNFNVVSPGELYRSGELPESALREVIDQYGIKTVIDLQRGSEPFESGLNEGEVVTSRGAHYVHLRLLSSKANQKTRILNLIDVLKKYPTPMLIHCTNGTHRSGFASLLWLLEKKGVSLSEAKNQLTFRYGYSQLERNIQMTMQGHETLDSLIERFELETSTNPQSFLSWFQSVDESSLGGPPVTEHHHPLILTPKP